MADEHTPATRQVERRLNLRLLPILVVLFAIVYILTGYRGWLVLFIGFSGAWLLAAIWVQSLKINLVIYRKLHLAWAAVGESVPEQLKLINHGWLPVTWLEITDTSTSTMETPLRLVSDVAQHSTRTRHLSHLFKHRGLYKLGPTHLRCGDPLGIYTLTIVDQQENTILVTPPILPLKQLQITSGGWAGDELFRRGIVERNISDAGVRAYIPGDSLRRIHWPASAHFDTLIVRQLEAAASRDWWIYADLEKYVQSGSGLKTTLELTIVLAASLAIRGLKEHRRVGLTLAGPSSVFLPPSANPSQRWRILRALAAAEAGERSLAELIIASQPAQTATAILITPSTNPIWIAATLQRFQFSNMMALLVDPTDFGSRFDQSSVISALARSKISSLNMPGSLLEEAYTSLDSRSQKNINGLDSGKRYLKHGSAAWQRMS
jgi:uncharacterized protein (DUF58 family)